MYGCVTVISASTPMSPEAFHNNAYPRTSCTTNYSTRYKPSCTVFLRCWHLCLLWVPSVGCNVFPEASQYHVHKHVQPALALPHRHPGKSNANDSPGLATSTSQRECLTTSFFGSIFLPPKVSAVGHDASGEPTSKAVDLICSSVVAVSAYTIQSLSTSRNSVYQRTG